MHTTWIWSADKTYVYRYDEVKKGLDGASFRKLDDFWGRDDSHVFCFATQRIYKNIDVDTFEVKTDGQAYDATYDYELVPNPNLLSADWPIHHCLDDYNYAVLKKRHRKT